MGVAVLRDTVHSQASAAMVMFDIDGLPELFLSGGNGVDALALIHSTQRSEDDAVVDTPEQPPAGEHSRLGGSLRLDSSHIPCWLAGISTNCDRVVS